MSYEGSCHCGAIRFSAEGTIGQVIECNCSIYMFNKHVIEHKFCATCGIAPYSVGKDPKGNEMAAINVRCLEGVDLAALKRVPFDGRSR